MLQSYVVTHEHWSVDPNDLDFTCGHVIEETSVLAGSCTAARAKVLNMFPTVSIVMCELEGPGRKKLERIPPPIPVPTRVPSPMRPADVIVVGGVGNVSKPLVIKPPDMVATKKWWKL
jgi:hypothetical protein